MTTAPNTPSGPDPERSRKGRDITALSLLATGIGILHGAAFAAHPVACAALIGVELVAAGAVLGVERGERR